MVRVIRVSLIFTFLFTSVFFCQVTLQSNLPVVNGYVNTIVPAGNTIYIGGWFSYVGPYTGNGTALDNSTGARDAAFPIVNFTINVVVPDGSGGWYIAGDFTTVGSYSRNRIAHILPDKSVDPAFNPDADGEVWSIAVSGSTLYAGGQFTSIGGQPRNYIAALDASTGLATSWNPNANAGVRSLALSGSTLYAGGSFTSIGGQTINYIAALNTASGLADASWNPNANDWVKTMVLSGSTLYAGGQFTSIGGQTRNYIAALDAFTGFATSWNPNASGGGGVSTIAVSPSGSTIYAGGSFTSIGGQTRNYIAALDASTGLADASWNPNPVGSPRETISWHPVLIPGYVFSIIVSGSTVYAGGNFVEIGGQSRNYIAALDASTGLATPWNPNASGGGVRSIALSGSTVYAGGEFNSIGGLPRNNIAALDASTGLVTSWDPNAWVPNAFCSVHSIAASGSTVYACGDFTSIGGQTRNRIAALDASTGLATSWDPNANNLVGTIAVSPSGSTVYAGGGFTSIGGQTRNKIAALDASSGLATSWDPNANNLVGTIAVSPSGSTVYAGGGFTSIGGQTRNRIAALDASSGLATSWDPNASSSVNTITLSGSTVYAGGDFTSIGGQPRNKIAALDASTGLATSWNPNAGNDVNTIAVSGSNVYTGGGFTSIGGQTRFHIAALDASTGLATSWDPEASLDVFTIAVSGSTVYAGGAFPSIARQLRSYFAGITDPALPVELSFFEALPENNKVTLKWKTATEVNNYGIEVERSSIPHSALRTLHFSDWETIGFVAGHGNSNSPHEYSFTDDNPSSGNLSYRLKQIDNDGAFKYYDAISVIVDAPKQYALLQNSPNPFNPSTAIKFRMPENTFVSIKVYDMIGREVTSLINEEKPAGSHTLYWNGRDINGNMVSSGVYFYKLAAGSYTEIRKMNFLK